VSHFRIVFKWLHQKHLLSADGEEEYSDGIDDTASLNEELLTDEGLKFLKEYYDVYLKRLTNENKYGNDTNGYILNELYNKYLSQSS